MQTTHRERQIAQVNRFRPAEFHGPAGVVRGLLTKAQTVMLSGEIRVGLARCAATNAVSAFGAGGCFNSVKETGPEGGRGTCRGGR